MLTIEQKSQFCDILEELGKSLDITENEYNTAVESYQAVGEQLTKENSELIPYAPEVIPQGSFMLGTMVRPINDRDDLDIDLVCQLTNKKHDWTQYDLKQKVGDQLQANATYAKMIKVPEGRRCWTLVYADDSNYHMDILPSIVDTGYRIILEKAFADAEFTNTNELAIRITDRKQSEYKTDTNHHNWLKSNPFGYGKWFFSQAVLPTRKLFSINESIQRVPKYQHDKLPLQRVVQILKRHRDMMFEGDDNKPISIIITTLAAKAYQKETDIVDALVGIIDRMHLFIDEKYSPKHGKTIKWVENPVNNEENFADKWVENKTKQDNFYDWLGKIKEDLSYLNTKSINENYETLKSSFGTRSINEAFQNAGLVNVISNSAAFPTAFSPALLTVSHRQDPIWQIRLTNYVEVYGRFKSGSKWKSVSPRIKIPKHCPILFNAITNVLKPFEVFWQVVNTGDEASKDLRGGIFHSKTYGVGGLKQKENSLYAGTHWIECFIVKDGICVARSNEFFVNVE
ncbi:MAG: nucleotidyltransferase [Bacteroidetes bacterium]|nr:nucleotidyltransferase [Bacteroidota bacterium]